jgi:hypothetical protein
MCQALQREIHGKIVVKYENAPWRETPCLSSEHLLISFTQSFIAPNASIYVRRNT